MITNTFKSGRGRNGNENYTSTTQVHTLLSFGKRNRLPVILQNEVSECGLACLAMIAGFNNNNVDLVSLRQKYSVPITGSTLEWIMDVAGHLGFAARALRLELNEVTKLHLPCILHWNMNHFVVLKEIKRNKFIIHDPVSGERSISLNKLNKSFTGVALELSPGPSFKRSPKKEPLSLSDLAGSIHGLGKALVQIIGLAAALELLYLITPQFLEIVIDQVIADHDKNLLTILGLSFSTVLIAQILISAIRSWNVAWIGSQFSLAWSGNVFRHLLRLPQSYFIKRSLGDIISRFGAIGTIQQITTSRFVEAIIDGLMAIVTLAMLFIYSVQLTIVSLSGVSLYLILRLISYRVFREANLAQTVKFAKHQSTLIEFIRGVHTIKIYNQTTRATSKFINQAAELLNASIFIQKWTLVFDAVAGLISGGQRVVVIWIGAWLILKGHLSAGMLIAYVAYAEQFTVKGTKLIDYVIQIRLLRIQGERLADIAMTPQETSITGTHIGYVHTASLELKNVSYRYSSTSQWVIKDCDLHIGDGEFVAITGPSGCGKSTLASLILGLLDPNLGKVVIGGVDLASLGKTKAREYIAAVMQDDQLFSGTISENISFFDPNATFEAVESAAIAAQIHDDIKVMPMGYFSLIGDMGSSLSGGQRQRLLLARALFKKPRILILDEATSQVDIVLEKVIADKLRDLKMTRLVIAHRPETIRAADRVFCMDGGAIVNVIKK